MVGLQYKKANKYVMKLYVNQKIQKEKLDVKIMLTTSYGTRVGH